MKTSKSVIRRKSIQMELTDVQKELSMFFNECFLKSNSNPITMAKQLTKKFDVALKAKKRSKS